MQENIYWDGYDKMKLHNAHRVMLVAVVLKPFHALPDVKKPFRTAAMLKKKRGKVQSLVVFDRQTDRRTLLV